jgi:hypothetical protein
LIVAENELTERWKDGGLPNVRGGELPARQAKLPIDNAAE